jgi:NAD(P)-dependent dehydrogenase (short-subunit alcohol dehydrogenase family)
VSVHQLATATREQHGRADIVVNNAGVGPQGAIADLTAADWRWLIDVNLFGVIHGIEAFLPLLRSSPTGGHIVNTASMSAFAPMVGLGAYAASKSAVAALTEVLAAELAESDPSIGVTLLAPGSVRTGIAESLRHRPESAGGGLRNIDFQQIAPPSTGTVWLEPREVGDMVVRAISDNEPYVITHPGLWGRVEARHGRLRSAFEAHPAHPGLPD